MTDKQSKQFQELNDLSVNIDERDLVNLKNNTEIVYKPTTMDSESIPNQKFLSLKPENLVESKNSLFLYRSVFIACLLAFTTAIGFSWTSPVIPKLQGPENPLNAPVDASQISIIASILCLGAAIGPYPFGYLADKIGRKKTLLSIAGPIMISMIILAFTKEVKMYYFARLLHGTSCGGLFTVMTMYIGEITEDHNRGKLSCTTGIFFALGVLYPFCIGPMLSIKVFCLSSLIPLTSFIILFSLYGPESPIFLIKKERYNLAAKTLKALRNQSLELVDKEIKIMQVNTENQKKEKGGIVHLFRSKAPRKAFLVSAGVLTIQQFSGINAVTGFLENIFLASGSTIPAQASTTFIGIIQVLTVFVTTSVVDRLGRKFLLLSSVVGSAVSIILLGLYFFLHKHQFSLLPYLWWLPILCLVIYIISFNLGLGPIPWTLVSELFPNNVKSSASALVTIFCFVMSFVVTMAFPIISEFIGMAESFWLFGICCIFGTIFIYVVVPETKGKTLAEIQEILEQ